MANIEKLNKISTGKSNWIDKAKERQENKAWLNHSQKIAVKVLRTLREMKMKQKELAEKIGVSPQQISKIIKGKENLTLETISKLENALNVNLILSENKPAKTIKEYIIKKEFVYVPVSYAVTAKTTAQQRKSYDISMNYNLNIVSEKLVTYGKC